MGIAIDMINNVPQCQYAVKVEGVCSNVLSKFQAKEIIEAFSLDDDVLFMFDWQVNSGILFLLFSEK